MTVKFGGGLLSGNSSGFWFREEMERTVEVTVTTLLLYGNVTTHPIISTSASETDKC